ncbi:IclR family transcriptional regulator [Herbaspirillum sp. GCM10030257]|uniref:IclR family transcriptional regulator n=1 Tax=Herbaspirillum sp. GCM10030257 TaxID=3273393 RepID=UPI00361B52E6
MPTNIKTLVEKREPRRIKSIEVGFRILRALEQEQRKLPLKEIAARAGMPASNAYLYLMSFVHEGMVEQDAATGHYSLGAFAIQLGAASLRQSSLIEIAKDLLTGLRNETRNSVYLSVWGNRGPTIVFKIDGDEYGPLGIRVGHVLPLLATATGRVFLSYIGDDFTTSLVEQERVHSAGLNGTFNDRIRNLVVSDIADEVKTNGYAHTDASLSGGYAASAAPVFDQSGRICAAITILRPEPGLSLPAKGVNLRLVETARELSAKLGWVA